MANPLVSIEELSRLIDGQLSEDEKAGILARIAQCDISKKLYDGMNELTQSLSKGIIEDGGKPPAEVDETQCPNEQNLMLLQENHLSPAMAKKIEAHVACCSQCLAKLMTEVRSAVSMNNANWKELPDHVITDPRLGGLAKNRKKPVKEPKKLVNVQTQEDDNLFHIDFDYVVGNTCNKEFPLPTGNLALNLKSQADSTVNAELTLRNSKGYLANSEVIVWDVKNKRKIFRGLSSSNGKIVLRRLRANIYDLQSEAMGFSLRLNIALSE